MQRSVRTSKGLSTPAHLGKQNFGACARFRARFCFGPEARRNLAKAILRPLVLQTKQPERLAMTFSRLDDIHQHRFWNIVFESRKTTCDHFLWVLVQLDVSQQTRIHASLIFTPLLAGVTCQVTLPLHIGTPTCDKQACLWAHQLLPSLSSLYSCVQGLFKPLVGERPCRGSQEAWLQGGRHAHVCRRIALWQFPPQGQQAKEFYHRPQLAAFSRLVLLQADVGKTKVSATEGDGRLLVSDISWFRY